MPAHTGVRGTTGPPLAREPIALAEPPSTALSPAAQHPRWPWLQAKELARPGFMTLHVVRHHGLIVDFVWDSACPVASRLLNHPDQDLRGRSLLSALANEPCCATTFARYRCVVQTGSAQAIRHPALIDGHVDIYRHGAVPLNDGVAVTLTNLSAIELYQAQRKRAHESNPPSFH